jgi:type VI secretion system protein ImpJ
VRRIFRIGEIECADENTGENPKPVQVRKVNSRLMFEGEDGTDMEMLPLLRVQRGTGEDIDLPRADPDYVPPCFLLTGSPALRELVRDLKDKVEATRLELVERLRQGGFSLETMHGTEFEQIMRLTTLNRFSARLASLVAAPNVTPFEMYLELRELLGELAALHPHRDPFEAAPYDHDNPLPVFHELEAKIRPLLIGTVPSAFIKVEFAENARKNFRAPLADEHFTKPNAWYLGISTTQDPGVLVNYVEDGDKFKLMPATYENRAVRGIALKYARSVAALRASSDLHYFMLDRGPASESMWKQTKIDKALVICLTRSQSDWSGTTFTLYMTLPSAPSKV